jgi:hypothetical protein
VLAVDNSKSTWTSVFRHNRRGKPAAAFQTLLGLGAAHRPTAYGDIRGAKDASKKTVNQ